MVVDGVCWEGDGGEWDGWLGCELACTAYTLAKEIVE